MVQFVLHGARICNLEVLNWNRSSLAPGTWESCRRNHGGLNGYKQAVGFQRCAEWMLPLRYTWIIRLRTDALLPFRLVSMPTAKQVEHIFGARGTAITGFVNWCECDTTPLCSFASLCGYTDDKFALLTGAHAQSAYLHGYGADFCHWDSRACRVCGSPGERPPEAKLGWSLATRAVPTRDIRFVSHHANPTLVRSSCSHHVDVIEGTWNLSAQSLLAIPTGGWSRSRRLQACLSPEQRKPDWQWLCLHGTQAGHPSIAAISREKWLHDAKSAMWNNTQPPWERQGH